MTQNKAMKFQKANDILRFIDSANIELDDKEVDFIEGMMKWVKEEKNLTPKQAAWLQNIFDKACSNYSTEGIPGDMVK